MYAKCVCGKYVFIFLWWFHALTALERIFLLPLTPNIVSILMRSDAVSIAHRSSNIINLPLFLCTPPPLSQATHSNRSHFGVDFQIARIFTLLAFVAVPLNAFSFHPFSVLWISGCIDFVRSTYSVCFARVFRMRCLWVFSRIERVG